MYRKTYVEIDLDKIGKNVKTILKSFKKYQYFFGVVKGSAYGHGLYVVNEMIEKGINYLAVSNLNEALEIRKYNKTIPILCLMPIDTQFLEVCSDNNITITISSQSYVEKIKNINLKLKIHLKVNSGMNRLGFDDCESLKTAIEELKQNDNFYVEGIFTHLGTLGINDPYRDIQLKQFKQITSLVNFNDIPIVHIDHSMTMMSHNKIAFCNGVRIGISLYGYNQLPRKATGIKAIIKKIKTYLKFKKTTFSHDINISNIKLQPALNLFSEVIEIKTVKEGEFVGYCGYIHKGKQIKVATVNIGYADGVDLRAAGGFVLINGKRYQMIGTINMGMISVKVDENVQTGDKVELFGENISIREISSHIGTTIYETMTTISPLLPRVYTKNNKVVKIIEEDL